jgi:hypothetical protein
MEESRQTASWASKFNRRFRSREDPSILLRTPRASFDYLCRQKALIHVINGAVLPGILVVLVQAHCRSHPPKMAKVRNPELDWR